jgi:predicted DNA-binding transcriptional regulator AlpA
MPADVIPFPPSRMRKDREPWVTKTQLAAHLGVSERWIELRYRDGLPHHKDGPSRLVRFRLSEVDAWMQSRAPKTDHNFDD